MKDTIDNMDDNDGSSPDSSPKREPSCNPIPNPPLAQVAAPYDFQLLWNLFRRLFCHVIHFHVALATDSLSLQDTEICFSSVVIESICGGPPVWRSLLLLSNAYSSTRCAEGSDAVTPD